MISIRRTNGLPQASFRFHFTVDTLAVLAMCFPLTGALRTFTFKNNVRAGRTEALSIPENELLGAVIAVGYRAINPDKPKRKTVDDILKLF